MADSRPVDKRKPPRDRHVIASVVAVATYRIPSASSYGDLIGFSAAAVAEGTVYTAGFTAVDADGGVVGPGDAQQAHEALRKLGTTLGQAGLSLADITQTRMYLVNREDWTAVGRAHGEVFGAIRPAATMVVVAALLDERMLVEIEAVAVGST